MGRLRNLSNSRKGIRGTVTKGNIIYDAVDLEANNELYETETTAKYPIGTRVVSCDGRVFRYALASLEVKPGFGAFNLNVFNAITGGCVNAQAVGDKSIVLLCDSTTGGTSWFGTENRMAGGYISLPTGTITQVRRIVSHAASANGSNVTVNLDGPLTEAVTAAEMCEVMQNPYSALTQQGHTRASVVGVPVTTIAAGSYGWIQTWGPTWITPSVAGVGSAERERTLIFYSDGSVRNINDVDMSTYGSQIAGFCINVTATGDWTNPPFVMLQISP